MVRKEGLSHQKKEMGESTNRKPRKRLRAEQPVSDALLQHRPQPPCTRVRNASKLKWRTLTPDENGDENRGQREKQTILCGHDPAAACMCRLQCKPPVAVEGDGGLGVAEVGRGGTGGRVKMATMCWHGPRVGAGAGGMVVGGNS
jgi:hypothetical protein